MVAKPPLNCCHGQRLRRLGASWRDIRVRCMYVLGQQERLLVIRPVSGEARFIELAKKLKCQIAID